MKIYYFSRFLYKFLITHRYNVNEFWNRHVVWFDGVCLLVVHWVDKALPPFQCSVSWILGRSHIDVHTFWWVNWTVKFSLIVVVINISLLSSQTLVSLVIIRLRRYIKHNSPHFPTLRREFKVWCVAEYFFLNFEVFGMGSNTCVGYLFSIETKTKEKTENQNHKNLC